MKLRRVLNFYLKYKDEILFSLYRLEVKMLNDSTSIILAICLLQQKHGVVTLKWDSYFVYFEWAWLKREVSVFSAEVCGVDLVTADVYRLSILCFWVCNSVNLLSYCSRYKRHTTLTLLWRLLDKSLLNSNVLQYLSNLIIN